MNIIKKFAATAGIGFWSVSASPPLQLPEPSTILADLPAAAEVIPPPTQEELVKADVRDFTTGFEERVRRGDRSSRWNQCFSRISKGREISYNKAVISNLRNPPDYKLAATQLVGSSQNNRSAYTLRASFQAQEIPQEALKPIFVIDKGHGQKYPEGYETGAKIGKVKEAEVVDAVGLQLENILREEMNAIVVTTRLPVNEGFSLGRNTRFSDQDKSLQIRAEMASYLRERNPDVPVIFISLHVNKAEDAKKNIIPGISGGLIFSYSPNESGKSGSVESRSLAKHISSKYRMNKVSEARTNDYAVLRCQYDPSPTNLYSGVAAVLVELGFVTNPQDRAVMGRALHDAGTARDLAMGIAKGSQAYLDSKKPNVVPVQIASNTP